MDKTIAPDDPKSPKQAEKPDAVGRAGTCVSKLVLSRGKRFLSPLVGSLESAYLSGKLGIGETLSEGSKASLHHLYITESGSLPWHAASGRGVQQAV